MASKQAKVLTRQQVRAALQRARSGRYPQRDRVMILPSVKAGLRAGEIAKLTWSMLLDADRRIADCIELHDMSKRFMRPEANVHGTGTVVHHRPVYSTVRVIACKPLE